MLSDEATNTITAFKMQMKMAGGGTQGSVVDSRQLTPQCPRFEVRPLIAAHPDVIPLSPHMMCPR